MTSIFEPYSTPMHYLLEDSGLPSGTRWAMREDGGFMHWHAARDQYTIALLTPGTSVAALLPKPGYMLVTQEALSGSGAWSVDKMGPAALYQLLERKIRATVQRHYFQCVHARGGYC